MKIIEKIHAYFRLMRLHTAATESLLILIGALVVGQPNITNLIILFTIGILFHIFFFVFNDIGDMGVDKLANYLQRKPLVSGDISKKNAIILTIFSIIVSYILIIFFFFSYICILMFSLSLVFGGLYDLYGKKATGYGDFLFSATLLFLFLFGASAISIYFSRLVILIGLLVFFGCFFANLVEGGLKDVDHDYKAGGGTLATLLGVKVKNHTLIIPNSFRLIAYSLMGICIFIFVIMGFDNKINLWSSSYLKISLVIFLLILIVAICILLLHLKFFDRVKIKRLYAILNSAAGILLLIVIMPLIGFWLTIILIIIPISWYIIFNIIVYGKPLQPLV